MKSPRKPDPYAVAQAAGGAPGSSTSSPEDAFFSARVDNGVHVITLLKSHVVDAYYIERLGDDIYRHLKPVDDPRLVVDLANVHHLSSSALGMLIALRTVVQKKDGKICLANVKKDLREIFKLTNLHKLLNIHDSTDKAVTSLA
ncbi:MAG: STAS domain-containing protein [Planctomycetota bacterium]|jgi:anti-sigma B factor antagonist